MKYSIFIVFPMLLFFIVSCSEKAKKEALLEEEPTKKIAVEKVEFQMSTFSGFPYEIEGCYCYFAKDSSSVLAKDFLFVSSYDSIAFIGLNNKAVMLELKESSRKKSDFGDTDHDEIYTNDSLKLEISWEFKNKTGFESWWNNGRMKVFLRDSLLGSTDIVGECGC